MHLSDSQVRSLRRNLLAWYDAHRRDLPWRKTRDPYRIWISEIMLQQTRVTVVVERHTRFVKRFPTVHDLAKARATSVLAEWSGLGYYRRARNLHEAARVVVQKHSGKFPHSQAELLDLPGIGRYTSAAIASIAWNEPAAVVDGNVKRVLSRLSDGEWKGEQVWVAAQALLDKRRPGDFNQAMMELGATACLPRQPRCSECPIRRVCRSQGTSPGKPKTLGRSKREIVCLLSQRSGSILLLRRDLNQPLMPGMWELPQIALPEPPASALLSLRHSITNTDYRVRVFAASVLRPSQVCTDRQIGRWVTARQASRLPLTGLARKILTRAAII